MKLPCPCGRVLPDAVADAARKRGLTCSKCGVIHSSIELSAIGVTTKPLTAPNPGTLARTSDPSPSHEAADFMVESGALGKAQRRALRAVGDYPNMTASELARSIGDADPRRINRRLGELEKHGLLRRGSPRRCSVSNRNAAVWSVATP